MKQYISYFRLKFIAGLQYRVAAFAGIFTQLFFGAIFIIIYKTFYASGANVTDISLKQIVTYLWLQQAFFSLFYIYYKDSEILKMIKNGDVAYELARPGNIYFKWFFKVYASKLSSVLLRFSPVIIIALLLPEPYRLMIPSLPQFLMFLITLIIGSILINAVITVTNFISLRLLDEKGISAFIVVIIDILAGSVVPLPLLPDFIKKIANVSPFRYMSDLSYRVYSGNILLSDSYELLLIQIIWTVLFIVFGYFLSKKIMGKIEVQGG